MKYQVGQKLRVVEDLTKVQIGDEFNIWTDMAKHCGEEVEIEEAKETKWGPRYKIKGSVRSWTESCFIDTDEIKPVKKQITEFTDYEICSDVYRRFGNFAVEPTPPQYIFCDEKDEGKLIRRNGINICEDCIDELSVHKDRGEPVEE